MTGVGRDAVDKNTQVPTRSLTDFYHPFKDVIEDIRNGRMVVVVDDEDRENEGDLIVAAQMATPESINFMAKYGRGLICLAMTGERIDQLGLSLMSNDNRSQFETAFTTSIEAREGVTTGISASDRARTVAVAMIHRTAVMILLRLDISFRSAPKTGEHWFAPVIPRLRSIYLVSLA